LLKLLLNADVVLGLKLGEIVRLKHLTSLNYPSFRI